MTFTHPPTQRSPTPLHGLCLSAWPHPQLSSYIQLHSFFTFTPTYSLWPLISFTINNKTNLQWSFFFSANKPCSPAFICCVVHFDTYSVVIKAARYHSLLPLEADLLSKSNSIYSYLRRNAIAVSKSHDEKWPEKYCLIAEFTHWNELMGEYIVCAVVMMDKMKPFNGMAQLCRGCRQCIWSRGLIFPSLSNKCIVYIGTL